MLAEQVPFSVWQLLLLRIRKASGSQESTVGKIIPKTKCKQRAELCKYTISSPFWTLRFSNVLTLFFNPACLSLKQMSAFLRQYILIDKCKFFILLDVFKIILCPCSFHTNKGTYKRDCRNLLRKFTFTNSIIIDTAILIFHTIIWTGTMIFWSSLLSTPEFVAAPYMG